MKFSPLYFFIALFLGFMIVYLHENDYRVIIKNKNCADGKCNLNIHQ